MLSLPGLPCQEGRQSLTQAKVKQKAHLSGIGQMFVTVRLVGGSNIDTLSGFLKQRTQVPGSEVRLNTFELDLSHSLAGNLGQIYQLL